MFSVGSRRSFLVAGLAYAMLSALPGCATLEPEESEKWRESQRPVLKARAEARWDALIKGDIEKAYIYTTPEYRAVVNLQQYKGKYGRVLDWRGARVVDISYDVPTVADCFGGSDLSDRSPWYRWGGDRNAKGHLREMDLQESGVVVHLQLTTWACGANTRHARVPRPGRWLQCCSWSQALGLTLVCFFFLARSNK